MIYRIISLLLIAHVSFAELVFEEEVIEWDAPVGALEMSADFKFTNKGNLPVTITAISTKCDCTVADLEKKTYAPGESGLIHGLFTLGDREGRHRKVILVATDVPNAAPIDLAMVANITPLFDVSPRMLFWRKGDSLESKIIQVRLADPDNFELAWRATEVENFTLESSSDSDGLVVLNVVPDSTDTPCRADVLFYVHPKNKPLADGELPVVGKRVFFMVR